MEWVKATTPSDLTAEEKVASLPARPFDHAQAALSGIEGRILAAVERAAEARAAEAAMLCEENSKPQTAMTK